MKLNQIIFFSALVTVLLPSLAMAQDESGQSIELQIPQARQGYYIGGGVGAMLNANTRSEGADTDLLPGSGGHFRLGQMLTPWLGFGLQFGGGASSDDRFETGYGGFMLDTQLVPFDHLAIHIGTGAGGLSLTDEEDRSGELQGTGGGMYMVGLSYDWFPFYDGGSGGLSVTPNMQFIYLPGDAFQGYVAAFTLDFNWWTGLEKNRLDLPIDEAFDVEN